MKNVISMIIATPLLLMIAGCTGGITNPVVFGQSTSVGISIGQSSATQAPELVLGYKDVNIAILPTAITQPDGGMTPIGSDTPGENGRSFKGTFSVLGQFEVQAGRANPTTDGNQAPPPGLRADLGKFFATGDAAKTLAAGFSCSVSDGKSLRHCHPPKATP